MDPYLTLYITARERDTIIAALRCWQHVLTATVPDFNGLREIAGNDRKGPSAHMISSAIDALIENKVTAAAE